ncbi:uncharacterized protein LOC110709899 [Chenopodium quinoa]|uniref:uncharacterized protein LOC110709899 n=1 Tax=Chenopodium quinoa TaxID=63459 RepID=UPI000B79028F|nr:uncharacterized protein LOC110709899 [Chenopodium quinoa]
MDKNRLSVTDNDRYRSNGSPLRGIEEKFSYVVLRRGKRPQLFVQSNCSNWRDLQNEKQKSVYASSVNEKLLYECSILQKRLEESSVNFLVEEEDKLVLDTSPSDAIDLLTTSDNRIDLLLAEYKMTYRSKRTREILAATAKSQDPKSSQSPKTTASKFHDPLSYNLGTSAVKTLASTPISHQPLQHPQPGKGGSQNLGTSAVKTSAATPISHQLLQHPQPGKGGSKKTSAATPQFNQTHQKSDETSNDISKKTKSLQPKSLADWPVDIDFDDKEEVLTIDANGNTTLVSGIILPIDVWSNSDLKYYVEFNDLCQPIRKGGHILVKFIGMIAKMETHCPLGEKNWHAIDNHIKGRIVTDMRDHFVIPNGVEYDNQALKRANKF